MTASAPSIDVARRVAAILGGRPVQWTPVSGRTMAGRWVAKFSDGRTAFVNAATDAQTAGWLRAEQAIYAQLCGEFMPVLLGSEEGERPILVLEDLSGAHWPPPWAPEMVDQVLAALAAIRAPSPSPGLSSLEEFRGELRSWVPVAADPQPFLALGLCTPAWLEAALPDLMAAEAAGVLEGPDLLHMDVRSDNLCFTGTRAVLVDWNWACRGNGVVDIAGWLSSLHAEGGPTPETILPDQPALAAILSGYWAFRAGKPAPGARVREVQRMQLKTALPWAAWALSLPPLVAVPR